MNETMLIKELPPQPVVSISGQARRHAVEEFTDEALCRLIQYLADKGLYPSSPPFVLCGESSAGERIALEVCVPTDFVLLDDGDINAEELPGGQFASAVYIGKKDNIVETYIDLVTWTLMSGYRLAGPRREVKLASFAGAGEDTEFMTEVLFPIKKVA
jgi:effector-binding domain-containing protein